VGENELGERLLGCAPKVHRALGPGLLESAYEACLSHELSRAGLEHQRQLAMPVFYEGIKLDIGYRLDILVEQKVVVELKTVDSLTDIHRAQLLSYLRLGGYRLGYVLNFNVRTLKTGICRPANAL
jgi:GxxExxY protein